MKILIFQCNRLQDVESLMKYNVLILKSFKKAKYIKLLLSGLHKSAHSTSIYSVIVQSTTYLSACDETPSSLWRYVMNKIYFTNIIYMQNSDQSGDSQIINLAINIFQNVGIKRWIDNVQILKNEQIYFQICKIIFPETIIHLFRLSENHKLTTGQKIQGVIDLIAKLIKNDLYHISGDSIAQGKNMHLKNFLQLLEALSNNMMLTKDHFEVESAPENDQSITYQDHHSYYTVIGMDKEFQKIEYSEEDESNHSNATREKQKHPQQKQRPNPPKKEETSEEEEFPIRPKNKKIEIIPKDLSKKKSTKNQAPSQRIDKMARKTPTFTSPQISQEVKQYPVPLREKNQFEFEMQNRRWLQLTEKMNQTKLNLQKQRFQGTKEEFKSWRQKLSWQIHSTNKQIQKQMKSRKKFITSKISTRQIIVKSLEGEKQATQAIKDLFKQQKRAKKIQKDKSKEREQENFKNIINFRQLNDLLQKAIVSSKPERNNK